MKCKYFYINKKFLFLLVCICCQLSSVGQINNQNTKQVSIKKIGEQIKIDGTIESLWSKANLANNFRNHRPSDEGLAQSQTEVRMLHDDQFIYILIKCFQEKRTHIIQNLKRDNFYSSNGVGIILDPINKQTNGFFFGVNSRGSQAECLVAAAGSTDWNWDAKWYSKVVQLETYWIAEIAIPFYTLRYNATNTSWGINFIRNDLSNNMYSTWTHFPTNFNDFDLGYTGTLNWISNIPDNRKRIALIPSLTGSVGKDFEDEQSTDFDFTPSLDAKVAVTSSLNLDLTINPDFSQIEVDRQVTNLSRFNLFFPERRTFFLENSDLFNDFGRWQVRPFFSRRIGLSNGENIPILFGARLTGNLTEKLRIGVMDVQTAEKVENDTQNFGVLALQQRVLKRSSIGGIFINRQNTSELGDYNRVAGTEFNYSSEKGTVSSNLMYYQSYSDGISGNNNFASGSIYFNARAYRLYAQIDHVGDNYITDVGFTPRLYNYDAVNDTTVRINYQQYNIFGAIDYRPTSGPIVFHGPRFQNIVYTNYGDQLNERITYLGYEIDFANQSQFDAGINNYRVNLLYPTDFIGAGEPLPAGIYDYTDFFLDWDSDPRKLFGYGTVFTGGGFYSGERVGLRSYIQYRIQPWLRLRLDHNYNRLDMGQYGKEDFQLLGLRTEISFSNTIFWTTFLQYNTQATNFNINSRFQWRFAPMSDFFIVYTDNYASDNFSPKNRYLSIKINYWLNL